MKSYQSIQLHDILKINRIVNISRVQSDKNFLFEGESHSFWEFQYVERGSVIVHANNEFYELHQGQAVFMAPDEFHILWGNGIAPAEFWVFSFHCDSPALDKLNQLIVNAPEACRLLMKICVEEAERNLERQGHPGVIRRKPNSLFGYEQIIKNHLETLLLLFLRAVLYDPEAVGHEIISVDWKPDALAEEIRGYLYGQVHSTVTLEEVADRFHVSESYAKKVYARTYGTGIISDFSKMKGQRAEQLLTETDLPVQEIAMLLDFKNIYYFSSWFKKNTGVSPTEYRKERHSSQ